MLIPSVHHGEGRGWDPCCFFSRGEGVGFVGWLGFFVPYGACGLGQCKEGAEREWISFPIQHTYLPLLACGCVCARRERNMGL